MKGATFAEKAKGKIVPLTTFPYPKEDQGLIFDHIDGLKIREYLLGIYELVGGALNIIAASRVSGGKVILFLSSREIVDKFQSEHGGFTVGDKFIHTRKLKAPAIRVILSNVSPMIPNSVLEKAIHENLGLKPNAPISILRNNPTDDIFSHIISWRRQFYLPANYDTTKIPPTITLTYEERTYRIFITTGDFTCFKCNQKGHKADQCPNIPFIEEEVEDFLDQGNPLELSVTPPSSAEFPPLPFRELSAKPPTDISGNLQKSTTHKRGSSTIASSTQSNTDTLSAVNDLEVPKNTQPKFKQNKKHKPNPEKYLKPLILTPAETTAITAIVNHIRQTKYPECRFTADDFVQFLLKIRNSSNRRQTAEAFTNQLDCLSFILEEIKPKLETGTKRTVTALHKSLSKDEPLSDVLSDNSDTS